MKIRIDFVTNSSSSSFLIVGVTGEDIISDLLKAENIFYSSDYEEKPPEGMEEYNAGYGVHEGKVVNFYGGYEPNYAGIEIEDFINDNLTLSEMINIFRETVKSHFGIDIPKYAVKLHYGEVSNE